jgi:hypothetical protein
MVGALSFACAGTAHGAAPAQKVSAIQAHQTHFFIGDTVLTASLTGMRLESVGRFGFVLVSRAPQWNVYVFRNDDKTYFGAPLKTFLESGLFSGFLFNLKDHEVMHKKPAFDVEVAGIAAKRAGTLRRHLDYLPLQNIAAPQVEEIIYATYKLPTNHGLPLAFLDVGHDTDWVSGADTRGKREVGLSTSKAARIFVSSDIFDVPAGYRKAKSFREVVSGQSSRDESKDFQDMFEIK